MTWEIDDPDFGEIRLPEELVSPEDFEGVVEDVREVFDDRVWPDGEVFECPRCGQETFEGRSDLAYRARRDRHVVSFRHLHGASCSSCGAKTLEPYEQIEVEEETGVGFHPDYEASVSRIGSGSLGTYWPRDVERVLNLHPDKRAFIEIIDRARSSCGSRTRMKRRRDGRGSTVAVGSKHAEKQRGACLRKERSAGPAPG